MSAANFKAGSVWAFCECGARAYSADGSAPALEHDPECPSLAERRASASVTKFDTETGTVTYSAVSNIEKSTDP